MRVIERTDYQWVNDLQQNGSTRLQAIAALRERLERGIYHYLSHERSDLVGRSDDQLRQIAQECARESLHKVLDNLALFRGTSQFTTWAAKLAARVSTTGLKCTDSVQLAPEQLNPMVDYGSAEVKDRLGMEQDVLERRIGKWEDEGGHVLEE